MRPFAIALTVIAFVSAIATSAYPGAESIINLAVWCFLAAGAWAVDAHEQRQ